MNIDVVILAAGQGTRMKSTLPKVLHKLAGKSLLQHVIDTAAQLPDSHLKVVVGHGSEQVKNVIKGEINWIVQEQQLGTGHAVQQALPLLSDDSTVLILYGDVPLTPINTIKRLIDKVIQNSIALLTVELQDATGYGRIVRSSQGDVIAIVEHKDASKDQHLIREINTGILAVPASLLKTWLPQLSNNNVQGEYYLTDIIAMAAQQGIAIETVHPQYEEQVQGVNSRAQLVELERWFQKQKASELLENGVTLADPERFDLRGNLQCGRDVFIDINVIIEGEVTIGDGVTIGANSIISNSTIANNVSIKPNSMIDQAEIAEQCEVGPYARIRPGTHMARAAKVGNFVEIKKSNIGEGSKVNHLSYIGDSDIGKQVNVGAGTITCNYDGVNKSRTVIEDEAFIGSNTSLVAPVSVGKKATVGAGSTITKNISDEELAVARGEQRNIKGWRRPQKQS